MNELMSNPDYRALMGTLKEIKAVPPDKSQERVSAKAVGNYEYFIENIIDEPSKRYTPRLNKNGSLSVLWKVKTLPDARARVIFKVDGGMNFGLMIGDTQKLSQDYDVFDADKLREFLYSSR